MRATYGQYTGPWRRWYNAKPDTDKLMAEGFRTERDPLGELKVPADAYYGVQTARAVENFPISGLRAPADLVTATILVKKAAAEANARARAARRRRRARDRRGRRRDPRGRLRDQFVVDVYQAGAGTSHNMNANEVLANRAAEILGEPRGTYTRACTPTTTSTWASRPTTCFRRPRAWRCCSAPAPLVQAARELADSLARKADAFAGVLKTGRTHLQDAVPMTLGQEFGGYAACVRRGRRCRGGVGAAAGAEHRRDGGRHRPQRRRRVSAARRRQPGAVHRLPLTPAGDQSVSRHAEHGRRARVLRRDAAAGRRSGQDRERPAAAQHGAARRACRRSRCRRCSPARRSCRAK